MISEIELVFRIVLAFVLGGIIGYERERLDKPAGLRTHILVAVGSAQFTILSFYAFPGSDLARIAAYVVAGIGFYLAAIVVTAVSFVAPKMRWMRKKQVLDRSGEHATEHSLDKPG